MVLHYNIGHTFPKKERERERLTKNNTCNIYLSTHAAIDAPDLLKAWTDSIKNISTSVNPATVWRKLMSVFALASILCSLPKACEHR